LLLWKRPEWQLCGTLRKSARLSKKRRAG